LDIPRYGNDKLYLMVEIRGCCF